MKVERFFRLSLTLLSAMAGGGCATHALWSASPLDTFNQPAQDAHLRIFSDDARSNLVVVYDEYSERHDSARTRAYRLSESESRIQRQRAPVFVDLNSLSDLKPVPVFPATNISATPPLFYAILCTNKESFVLCSGGQRAGPYSLPVYNDGKARMERIALTPLAATADATIVGGVVGYICAYWLCESGASIKGP